LVLSRSWVSVLVLLSGRVMVLVCHGLEPDGLRLVSVLDSAHGLNNMSGYNKINIFNSHEIIQRILSQK